MYRPIWYNPIGAAGWLLTAVEASRVNRLIDLTLILKYDAAGSRQCCRSQRCRLAGGLVSTKNFNVYVDNQSPRWMSLIYMKLLRQEINSRKHPTLHHILKLEAVQSASNYSKSASN